MQQHPTSEATQEAPNDRHAPMTVEYFDRKGRPITQLQWALRSRDPKYRLIAQDNVANIRVCTFWAGVATAFDLEDRPMIFETAMYLNGMIVGRDGLRFYALEDDAHVGHLQVVSNARLLFTPPAKEER